MSQRNQMIIDRIKGLPANPTTWMAHLEAARIILKNQDRNGWEDRIYAALQQITAGKSEKD